MHTKTNPQPDQFLEEVLGLFALEAQEWLGQGNAALLELERNPSSEEKAKLCKTIACGVTNLGGSAATIELPAIEKLAFALIPLLEVMGARSDHTSSEQVAALREGFDAIILAIERLGEDKTDMVPGFDRIAQRLTEAANLEPIEKSICESSQVLIEYHREQAAPTVLVSEVLDRLQRFHAETGDTSRRVAVAVIREVKARQQADGFEQADRLTVMQVLQELDALDERFLGELRERLPVLVTMLSDLRLSRVDALTLSGRLDTAFQEIHVIQELARTIDANAICVFFHGLRTFLTILCGNVVAILPQCVESVEFRLQALLSMAQHWVEIGKNERASLQRTLNN
jgi:chemotaxis protein histidine kinase CheA